MDNTVLKKKLSTFRSEKGSLIRVSSDVLFEVLRAWEAWTDSSKDFYKSIGVSQKQMASILGKAKRMCREGGFPAEDFKEISVATTTGQAAGAFDRALGIELAWEQGKVIRFCQVEQLVDFLKKVA